MMDNHITSKMNVTNSPPCGVSIPQKITKRDVAVFGTLLMKCRSLDVGRKIQKDGKLTGPDVDIIRAFCIQAIEDVHRMERGEHPEGFAQKKEVVS